MLTMTRITPSADKADGSDMLAYLKATEYYLGKDGEAKDASAWIGAGCAAFGLSGVVDFDIMEKLAQGFAPDGQPLVQNAGDMGDLQAKTDRAGNPVLDDDGQPIMLTVGGRVLGWDCTFSAPKSVSILMAAAGQGEERESILDAHQKAVATALEYLESRAEVRTGQGGKEVQATRGLVATSHLHFGSRDLDPQLHTHTFVMNLAQGEDGQWRSLETESMFAAKRDAGALYRFALAANLKELGYGIEAQREVDLDQHETGECYFNVAGISKEMEEEFSKRRQAILDHHRENGGTLQEANKATRKHKDEPSFKELDEMWRVSMDDFRRANPDTFQSVAELKGRESRTLDDADDAKTLDRLHTMEAVFADHHLLGRLARDRVGSDMSVKDLFAEMQQFAERTHLHRINPETRPEYAGSERAPLRYREARFASPAMVAMEEECVTRALDRKQDRSHALPAKAVDDAIERYQTQHGFTLTAEQQRAVRHVASDTGAIAVISGQAGTGKTTVSAVWIDALQQEGHRVLGASTSWAAAKKLEAESQIPSYSTASLLAQLDDGRMSLDKKDVVVLDEAGMVGTQTLVRLQRHVDQAGAKLVLQGDHLQLQPVEAGAGFRLIREQVGEAKLTEIRRQKDAEDRATASQFYEGTEGLKKGSRSRLEERSIGANLMQRLTDRQQIDEHRSGKEAVAALAKDYLASEKAARDRLIIAGDRNDIRRITEAVREGRRERGEIGPGDASIEVKVQGRAETLGFAQHDRIRFTAKDKALGVVNGEEGVIKRLTPSKTGGWRIEVELESDIKSRDGVRVAFDTKDCNAFTHAYAMTVHKSQGQGRAQVFQLANAAMTDQHLALVGFTRTKEEYRLYGSTSDLDEIARRMGKERLKENAIEAGVRPPAFSKPALIDTEEFKRRLAKIDAYLETHRPFDPPATRPPSSADRGMER